jgi:hypothetical protein
MNLLHALFFKIKFRSLAADFPIIDLITIPLSSQGAYYLFPNNSGNQYSKEVPAI